MKIDRREFLKKVGLGSLAAASLPAMANALARPVWAQGQARRFIFVAFSRAGIVEGVDHQVAAQGEGWFKPDTGEVDASGSFLHFNDASPVPKFVINTGKWRATKILSYSKVFGTYGHIAASVLELRVDLFPDLGPVRKIEGATLRLICNIGPAGVTTGEPEGYVLTVPGSGLPPFRPLTPIVGITHISVPGG